MTTHKSNYTESFKEMWGNYPAPVILVNKAHDIVAYN